MKYKQFNRYVTSLRHGCKNRLDEVPVDETEQYYLDAYNGLTGIFMSINAQRKDDE